MLAALLSLLLSASGLSFESLYALFFRVYQEVFMLHDLFLMGFSVLGLVAVVVVRRLLAEGPGDLDHPPHAPPHAPPGGEERGGAPRSDAGGHRFNARRSAMLPGAGVLANGFEM